MAIRHEGVWLAAGPGTSTHLLGELALELVGPAGRELGQVRLRADQLRIQPGPRDFVIEITPEARAALDDVIGKINRAKISAELTVRDPRLNRVYRQDLYPVEFAELLKRLTGDCRRWLSVPATVDLAPERS